MFMKCKTLEISWVLMLKHYDRGLGEDGRGLKQMFHEMPFKKLIWEFSQEADLRNYLRNFSRVCLTRELLAKRSRNSLYKVEKHEIWTI